jgi:GNAT superfamily N-acetyltransferase
MPGAGTTIQIRSPTTDDEWREADALIAEFKQWDLQQCEPLGFDAHTILSVFYPDTIDDIRRDSVSPNGCFLLARDGDLPVGCAAFRRLTSSACELFDVYVRPIARGHGLARLLLEQLISNARLAGYRSMCLETASFMQDAHKLYRSLGFKLCEPYRSIPPALAPVTLWMECHLEP